MEKQLETLQIEIDSSNENVNHETYYSIKKELEEIKRLETNSKIFRAKVEWIEEGETNSKYFLNLEKRNYINKLITTLEIDGEIIKEPTNVFKQKLISTKPYIQKD